MIAGCLAMQIKCEHVEELMSLCEFCYLTFDGCDLTLRMRMRNSILQVETTRDFAGVSDILREIGLEASNKHSVFNYWNAAVATKWVRMAWEEVQGRSKC